MEFRDKKYEGDIQKEKILTPAEERVCIRLAKEGNIAARNMLVRGHLRFITGIARKLSAGKAAIGDLVSAGVIGLDAAIAKYDPSHGVSFLSFAVWYIRMSIQKEVRRFGTKSGVDVPTSYSAEKIREIGRRIKEGENVPFADAAAYWAYAEPTYIDTPLPGCDHDNALTFGDVLPDRNVRADTCIDGDTIAKSVEMIRSTLSPLEKDIFDSTIYTDMPLTHEELGLRKGLSRERIRQIKNRIVRKMRCHNSVYAKEYNSLAEVLTCAC